MTIQRSGQRGFFDHGWLQTHHSFSFADYYNESQMGFGLLRVLNEDTIAAGRGFGTHPHENMEIVTIVLAGALEHRDSAGNIGVINAGEAQRMSVGTGVEHSEYNHSKKESVHLLQIWVMPQALGIKPNYEQMAVNGSKTKNKLLPIASNGKLPGTMKMNQDAVFLLGSFEKGKSAQYLLANPKHGAYAFVISGKISIGKETLSQGDAAGITGAKKIEFAALEKTELLVIEVPMA